MPNFGYLIDFYRFSLYNNVMFNRTCKVLFVLIGQIILRRPCMAPSLKKYVAVGFFSEQEAQQALSVALAQFRKGCSTSDDLTHCEGNIVYLCAESKHE